MSHCGIQNHGNECFINATLQCLASSPFIINFINNYNIDDANLITTINKFNLGKLEANDMKLECSKIISQNKTTLSNNEIKLLNQLIKHSSDIYIYITFKEIIKTLNTKSNSIINNSPFISIVKDVSENTGFNHLFTGEQNDPHEFMAFLLDRIHNSKQSNVTIAIPDNIENLDIYYKLYIKNMKSRYENDYSFFVKNFYYYILNCVECYKCKNKSYDVCPSDIMCVSIPSIKQDTNITIYDCLNEMFRVETIDYKCEKCGNTENNRIEKKLLSKPKTIIIKIKRYISDNFMNRLFKVNKMIHYPEVINLNSYICGDNLNDYELYGVINHTGTMQGGHYYSFIKKPLLNNMKINNTDTETKTSSFNNQWICCNDSQVSNISDTEALSSQYAYILFYNLI